MTVAAGLFRLGFSRFLFFVAAGKTLRYIVVRSDHTGIADMIKGATGQRLLVFRNLRSGGINTRGLHIGVNILLKLLEVRLKSLRQIACC